MERWSERGATSFCSKEARRTTSEGGAPLLSLLSDQHAFLGDRLARPPSSELRGPKTVRGVI